MQRKREIDIMRGISILGMILIHVTHTYNSVTLQNEFVFSFFIELITDVAVIFMFVMGMSLYCSRRKNWQRLMRRGVILIVLAYLLNFARGVVPEYIINNFEPSLRAGTDPWGATGYAKLLLDVDIYHFAGAFFLILGLLTLVRFSVRISLTMLAVCSLLTLVDFSDVSAEKGLTFAGYIKSYFLPVRDNGGEGAVPVFFPFFSWCVYPAAGYAFMALQEKFGSPVVYKYTLKIAAAVMVIAIPALIMAYPHFNPFGLGQDISGYFLQDSLANILLVVWVLLWISVAYYANRYRLIPCWLQQFLEYLSGNIVPIYLVHWLVIGYLRLYIKLMSVEYSWQEYLLYVFVLFVSIVICELTKIASKRMRTVLSLG